MTDASPLIRVPYLDLYAQYESIKYELRKAIDGVFTSSRYVLGPAVSGFEHEFAAFCGNAHCIGVSNGTAALHLALVALGIGSGDEVITQANTFIATVAAIHYTGATPVLVDIHSPSYTIDGDAVERAITSRTKAILPVHLFGQPCDLNAIRGIAQRHGVPVVEDASQAHGATYQGMPVGSGDIVTFSFYPGKNLGAAGEAGGIVVRDEALARRLRLLRNHGSETKYIHSAVGYNYRLDGLQEAILEVKVRHLARWTAAREGVARRYDRQLASFERPIPLPGTTSAFHVYPLIVDDRDGIAVRLKRRGVETNMHYPVPCHLQPGYAHLGYRKGDFPHTERLADKEISLPIYPELTLEQIDHVAASIIAEAA